MTSLQRFFQNRTTYEAARTDQCNPHVFLR
jgi:hypothetical protein